MNGRLIYSNHTDPDRYALITGASRGIGAAFARQLAARGTALILTGRDGESLHALQAGLMQQYGVAVEVLVEDLAVPGGARKIFEACQEAGWAVRMLVNNAGFGRFGTFEQSSIGDYEAMIRVNMQAPVELVHYFLPVMREAGQGTIINLASVAAFQPTPYMGVYGASKAFLRSFSQSLAVECRGTGIRVLAVCPGATRTDFFATGGLESTKALDGTMQSADEVVAEALRALDAGRMQVITGWLNRVMVGMVRLSPERVLLAVSGRLMKNWSGARELPDRK